MARLVVPGLPHHVTQRGIRKLRTFYDATDYLTYLELIRELKGSAGVAIWSYCLMPNHVHFVVVPEREDSLAALFRPAHSRYARKLNASHGWRGHLWQERFFSVVMDEVHAIAAMRYVELNPVRAGLCANASDWRWSSAELHLDLTRDDPLDCGAPRDFISDWFAFLAADGKTGMTDRLRKCTRTGRPAGDDSFLADLERRTGRTIRPRRPGPSPVK